MSINSSWISALCPQNTKQYSGYDSLIDSIKTWLNNHKKYAKKHKININDYLNDLRQKAEKSRQKKQIKKKKGRGRKKGVKKIEISENNRSCLLLTGNHGIGKTSLVLTILKEMGYCPEIVNYSEIARVKDPEGYASNIMTQQSIQSIVSDYDDGKRVIIIDNVESIKFPNEKKFSMALIEENNKFWKAPVIFISDNKHNKFTNKSIKPFVYELYMNPPSTDDMMYTISVIMDKTKMLMTEEDAHKIIEKSKADYRKLLSIMEKLYHEEKPKKDGTRVVSDSNMQKCFEFYQSKDKEMDIYFSTNALFTEDHKIDDALAIYETEKTLYPLMVQRNHINVLLNHSKNPEKKLDTMEIICDSLARGDITENQVHGKQDYGLQRVQGYYSCVYTGKKIKDALKKDAKINMNSYQYISNYNNESIKNINKNNLKKAKINFGSMGIMDILYAKKVIYELTSKDKHKTYEDVISGYGASPENVSALIKVDKVVKTKSNIPPAIARAIKKLTK